MPTLWVSEAPSEFFPIPKFEDFLEYGFLGDLKVICYRT